MIQHFNVHISGKVQGVFYRASAKEKADEMNVMGFVQNESDGSVYLEAEGTEEQLEKFIEWCRQGPPRSIVQEVKSAPGPVQRFQKFEIRR